MYVPVKTFDIIMIIKIEKDSIQEVEFWIEGVIFWKDTHIFAETGHPHLQVS